MKYIHFDSGEPTAIIEESRDISITCGRMPKSSVVTCAPLTMSVTLMKLLKRSAANTWRVGE